MNYKSITVSQIWQGLLDPAGRQIDNCHCQICGASLRDIVQAGRSSLITYVYRGCGGPMVAFFCNDIAECEIAAEWLAQSEFCLSRGAWVYPLASDRAVNRRLLRQARGAK
jgi:hypothetical protein